MKVYFFKSDVTQYQIFPVPENLEDFIEIEVIDEINLDTKQLVLSNDEYILVDRSPSDLHEWKDNAWVIDAEKLQKLIEQQRQQVINLISVELYKHNNGGVYVPNINRWCSTDESAERNLLNIKATFDLLGDSKIEVTCADGSSFLMDKEVLTNVWQAIVDMKTSNQLNATNLIESVKVSTDPLSIDYNTGWSQTYEEFKSNSKGESNE